MALATYDDLKTAIADWLQRPDLASRAADLITLAEADFRRQLVMPEMETIVSVSGMNPIPLPADFDSLRAVASPADVWQTVTPISLAEFYDLPTGGGRPAHYAVNNAALYLWPQPTATTSLTLAYRAKLPALSDAVATNWLLTDHPDAYLYGSLLQAEFYGWNDERLPLIQAKLQAAIDDINRAGNRKRYGGQLAMRPPVVEQAPRSRYAFKW